MEKSAKITGKSITDEAREPSINVVLIARDLRWNSLGHVLRMSEQGLVRQALLQFVKVTPESIFGDVPELDIKTGIQLATDRIERKTLRLSKRC